MRERVTESTHSTPILMKKVSDHHDLVIIDRGDLFIRVMDDLRWKRIC